MFRNFVEWTRGLHVHHVDNEEHYHSLVVLHGATLQGMHWWCYTNRTELVGLHGAAQRGLHYWWGYKDEMGLHWTTVQGLYIGGDTLT